MTILEIVYLAVGGFFFLLFLFMAGWYQNPANAASLKRLIMRKPYGVVGLVYPAGQIKFYSKKWDMPSFQIGGKVFTSDYKLVKYSGSIPYCFFNVDDCLQLNISAKQPEDLNRSPIQIDSAYMITKSLYEAKALKRFARMELIIFGIAILCVAIGVGLLIVRGDIGNLSNQVAAVSNSLNQTINSLPNLLGGQFG
jgi:hypothetical protein